MPQTCHQPAATDVARFLAGLHAATPSAGRLTALAYIADRLSILRHWHTLTEDRFACHDGIPYGIGTRRVITVLAGRKTLADDRCFGSLSVAGEDILRTVYADHGAMGDTDLLAAMRRLPESAADGPIAYLSLATHLAPDDPVGLRDALETDRGLRWCFERLVC